MDNKEKLEEVISSKLDEMKNLEGDELKDATREIETLYKLKNEADKIEVEKVKNEQNLTLEQAKEEFRVDQELDRCKSEKKQNILQHAKDFGQLAIGAGTLVLYAVMMSRGFKFEEDGTYTSDTFRNLRGKIKP